jgi:hypothetical protein
MDHAAIHRIPVVSSLLASAGSSPHAVLEVELRSGAIYRYFTVPRSVFDELMAAPSKGIYFNDRVKTRFPCQRVA